MANVAVPGSGSLTAGRAPGYGQLALAVGGLILTILFGLPFIVWYIANWSRLSLGLYGEPTDAFSVWAEIWLRLKGALLGIGLFGLGWLWALSTSLLILRSAKNNEPTNLPPRLH